MKNLLLHIDSILLTSDKSAEWQQTKLLSLQQLVRQLSTRYNVWVAGDSTYAESIVKIRQYLKNLIPQNQIQVFSLPFVDTVSPDEIEVRKLLLDYFINQFPVKIILAITLDTSGNTYAEIKRKRFSEFNKTDKPSLAFFAPIPPAKSGIASYSSELLPYLSRYYDITLVIEQDQVIAEHGNIHFPYITTSEFLQAPDKFDRKLYHFGNSFYHSYMWPVLKQYPGVVVLHDFYLSGLLSYEEFVNNKIFFWTEQLFKSHGYQALKKRFTPEEHEASKLQYPCNYEVLQYALGIIVHSEYSKKLGDEWYIPNSLHPWVTIPHLRVPAKEYKKSSTRKILGFGEQDLVICSFGLLNSTKQNHKLLHAFLNSSLAVDPRCKLVFVGEFTCPEYEKELLHTIRSSSAKNRIHITGWVSDKDFEYYLQAADIGVQLRTESRGETSGTVLDCMNYGLATIVNANGSMATLPSDAVFLLEDNFEESTLIEVLEKIQEDTSFRKNLGDRAKNHILTYHNPEKCAQMYKENIEAFFIQQNNYNNLINKITDKKSFPFSSNDILHEVSKSISHSTLQKITQGQLLVDVSAVVQHDLRTGIQRVVRAQLLELIKLAPKNIRVEPIYLTEQGGLLHYRYARKFACDVLNIPLQIDEAIVEVKAGDVFYGLDFHWDGVINATQNNIYSQWKAKGVSINFAVYDLLPISYPEFFPENSAQLHTKWLNSILSVSDSLICISQAVADELANWASTHCLQDLERGINITAVHLGSDIAASSPSDGLSEDTENILESIKKAPIFLMVGTIEPRKGYLQTLDAFDNLWAQGIDIHLVIVGKEGWIGLPDTERITIPKIIHKLETHPQLGKKLFWLKETSDVFLETLYCQSDALIAASENEGFGLPLIEAAHYKLPIIARDIPVFKEVSSEYAFYFKNSLEPSLLAEAIMQWLKDYQHNQHITSQAMPYMTWEENTQKVLKILINKQ